MPTLIKWPCQPANDRFLVCSSPFTYDWTDSQGSATKFANLAEAQKIVQMLGETQEMRATPVRGQRFTLPASMSTLELVSSRSLTVKAQGEYLSRPMLPIKYRTSIAGLQSLALAVQAQTQALMRG